MRRAGREIRCDRCGKTVFQIPEDGWYGMLPGWGQGRDDCDLCDECYEVFIALIDGFMEGYPKHDD